jgi:hypothetical protein
MRLLHSLRLALCVTFSLALSAGCNEEQLASMFSNTKMPHVSGRWTGHIQAVNVYDPEGNEYPAAALVVSKGPSPIALQSELDEHKGGGRMPLLVSDSGKLLNPSELPLDQRVEIDGEIGLAHALVAPPDGAGQLVARRSESTAGGTEVILLVHGKPKVMK